MLEFCDLKTSELLSMARQAVHSCTKRLEEIGRACDPSDQPLKDLLRKLAADQGDHAELLEHFESLYAEESSLPARSDGARALIQGYLTSLTRRMGEGPLLRDAALFYAESLDEEASRLFRALAGHARESRVVSMFSDLADWERENVSYLREIVLQG